MSAGIIYTIGYSGYGNETTDFMNELKKRKINVLIDVRSNPYSAQFNRFNKDNLSKTLENEDIKYRNYAEYFGAKQIDAKYYSRFDGENNRIDYDIFTDSDVFKKGVLNMKKIIDMGYTPVLMCSEKDPIHCHRAIMIARVLFHAHGFQINHIVPDKKDESHEELEKRMIATVSKEVTSKRHLNNLEQALKDKIADSESLFPNDAKEYIEDINNYYRIINSRIGWTREEVLGYKK